MAWLGGNMPKLKDNQYIKVVANDVKNNKFILKKKK